MTKKRSSWKAIRDTLQSLERLAKTHGFDLAWELTPMLDEREKMSNEIQIEIKAGETTADALLRVAKERTGKSFASPKPTSKPAPQTPKPTPKKPPAPSVESLGGDPMSGVELDEEIYAAFHIYRRENETIEKLRYNARREREMHGPGVLVFAHDHLFGGECSSTCKAKITIT